LIIFSVGFTITTSSGISYRTASTDSPKNFSSKHLSFILLSEEGKDLINKLEQDGYKVDFQIKEFHVFNFL
jgi:hypothetical protein